MHFFKCVKMFFLGYPNVKGTFNLFNLANIIELLLLNVSKHSITVTLKTLLCKHPAKAFRNKCSL